jgi:hypothetical protein
MTLEQDWSDVVDGHKSQLASLPLVFSISHTAIAIEQSTL